MLTKTSDRRHELRLHSGEKRSLRAGINLCPHLTGKPGAERRKETKVVLSPIVLVGMAIGIIVSDVRLVRGKERRRERQRKKAVRGGKKR